VTAPVPVGSIRLYDRVEPALPAGVYRISSEVEVAEVGNPGNVLAPAAPERTHLEIGGPRFRLGPTEVAAVHPAGGATGAFGERLPHVVLGRHTLPWERRTAAGAPWLALLVAKGAVAGGKPAEVTLASGPLLASVGQPVYDLLGKSEPADPQEPVTVARFADAATLRQVLPTQAEVALLAHVRQVNVADTALDLGDDDGWFAVVAANRLPLDRGGTGTPYVAMLVSLEGRDDLWNLPAAGPAPPLIVLHTWEFTTAGGGTFEGLAAGLDVGAFPADPVSLRYTDRTGTSAPANYRGPLGSAPPVEPDISLAAAYELGRLLGAADGRFTREIVGWHRTVDAQARTLSTERVVAEALGAPVPVAVPLTAALRGHAGGARPAASTGEAGRLSVAVAAALRAYVEGAPPADRWGVHPAARALLEEGL
jgi:hypothetical protein